MYRKSIDIEVEDKEVFIQRLERYKKLVETQWSKELASLAKKDMESKAAEKPALLPVTEDIMKLKKYVDATAAEAYNQLTSKHTQKAYSVLAETTLISSIVHNRKRVGDVQYLQVESFQNQRKTHLRGQTDEFLEALSSSEKILMQHYVRIVTIGKGSRSVPVLIPRDPVLKYYDMLNKVRVANAD